MIHVTATPLTNQEVFKLRSWLQAEEAELLRLVLISNLADLQARAGQSLIESDDQNTNQDQDAVDAVHEASPFVHTLALLDEFRSKDNRLIRVTLSVNPPVKIPETT